MVVTNDVVWRALQRMMRDRNLSYEGVFGACHLDVSRLRATRGVTPEIMAADVYEILCAAHVSLDDFVKYFPKKIWYKIVMPAVRRVFLFWTECILFDSIFIAGGCSIGGVSKPFIKMLQDIKVMTHVNRFRRRRN